MHDTAYRTNHYREVVSYFRGTNVLPLYRLVNWKVSLRQRCPLLFNSYMYMAASSVNTYHS